METKKKLIRVKPLKYNPNSYAISSLIDQQIDTECHAHYRPTP